MDYDSRNYFPTSLIPPQTLPPSRIIYFPIEKLNRKIPTSRPPSTLPLLGNGLTFLQPRHILLDFFTACSHLGTYEISVPTLPPGIIVNDPQNVEYILRNHEIFVKGHIFKNRSWDLFGM